jgi:hypothetical protein
MTGERDRIRTHTAKAVLRRIDDQTTARLLGCAEAPSHVADERLRQLDREWDTDRVVETEAAAMGLLGLALGAWLRPQLLALPAFVAAGVLVQALTGRYPLMPIFRRFGVRTSREIARERYALKALRGDFQGLDRSDHDAGGLTPLMDADRPGIH